VAAVGDLVAVTRIAPGVFTGRPVPVLRGSMFGGQLVGQCLSAAAATVSRHRWPVSMHLYFISAPTMDADIVYRVEKRRDGGRYAWRSVVGTHGDRVVLEAIVSFASQPPGTVTPGLPPGTPGPEDLPAPDEVVSRSADLVGDYLEHVTMGCLDVRWVEGAPPLRIARGDDDPRQRFWLRSAGKLRPTALETASVLAFYSDVNLLAMPLLGHGELGDGGRTYAVSVDHSLRFYSPLDELDWMLYSQESVVVSGTTMESRGSLLTRDGRLALTVAQQGLSLPPPA
jgi:acyl-CoA thioesterase-2